MKDQYFGDINDYRKYGLLRSILRAGNIRLMVAWMLTPDDGSTDGKFISYLKRPDKWAHHDPFLFQRLNDLMKSNQGRRVGMIEDTDLLLNTEYFSTKVPDTACARAQWFESLSDHARACDLVFLDPDNGLEVTSKPYGGRNSSKFLYWREVEALWAAGRSLLIYQHFIRERRAPFVRRMLDTLSDTTPGSFVEAFSTPHVVFLMALQPEHRGLHEGIVQDVQERWASQIRHWDLLQAE